MELAQLNCNKYFPSYNKGYSTHRTPNILVVDDDEDNLMLLTCVLEPFQCSVITAVDGNKALEAVRSHPPDLILLDIMLSKVDGIQIVKQLRQNPQTMTIPVIAVTALAREEDKQQILKAGCNDYISKPFMIEDLEDMIQRYLHPNFCVA